MRERDCVCVKKLAEEEEEEEKAVKGKVPRRKTQKIVLCE